MILGYLDSDDRAYDLTFATLRLKVRMEAAPQGGSHVVFAPTIGTGASAYGVQGEAEVIASVSMDHGGDLVPLLRPVTGHLVRHERGLLFLASPARRDAEDPTFFLVKLQALPEAVKFFFEDREGRELISIPDDEILGVSPEGDGVRVSVTAASLALPKEKLAYAADFKPASRAQPLLRGLGMSAPP